MDNKTKLLKCEMYKQGDNYYLELEYEIEKSDGIYRRTFPKVDLCIPKDHVCLITETSPWSFCLATETKICLRNGSSLPLIEFAGELYSDELIEKKTQKMTVAEIEKELGYSIEIVSEK